MNGWKRKIISQRMRIRFTQELLAVLGVRPFKEYKAYVPETSN
jgi:hypothetical protein